jgi:hypothetical protein
MPTVRVVSTEELLAGKLTALLERSAPRDVWDAANLPRSAAAAMKSRFFRAVFIAFAATLEHPLTTYGENQIRRSLSAKGIEQQLAPMLISGSKVNPDELVKKARSVVRRLVVPKKNETDFLSALERGELRPALLAPKNPELAQQIASHPALLWKLQNIRLHTAKTVTHP